MSGNDYIGIAIGSSIGGDLITNGPITINKIFHNTIINIEEVLQEKRLDFKLKNRVRIAINFFLAGVYNLVRFRKLPQEEFRVVLASLRSLGEEGFKKWFNRWIKEIGRGLNEELSKPDEERIPQTLYNLADKLRLAIAILDLAGSTTETFDISHENFSGILLDLQMIRDGIIEQLNLLGVYAQQLAEKQKNLVKLQNIFKDIHLVEEDLAIIGNTVTQLVVSTQSSKTTPDNLVKIIDSDIKNNCPKLDFIQMVREFFMKAQ